MQKKRIRTLRLKPHALSIVGGTWYLDGHPLRAGDPVEIRRARIGDTDVGEDWVPAVVSGDTALLIELEEPGDFVPGSRSTLPRSAGLRTLALSAAELRRG